MDSKEIKDQKELVPSDDIDSVSDFSDLIKDRAFIGEFPLEVILEGIKKQFEDYINLEDRINYVEIFYKQLYDSLNRIRDDDSEEHPQEIKEILTGYYSQFIELVKSLFTSRLAITVRDLESEEDDEDVEFAVKRLYEFFILSGKRNLKTVISQDILKQLDPTYEDDTEFFTKVNDLIEDYSPLLVNITPEQFLAYCGDKEVINLFENNQAAGNFLRKFSPKLYQNEEFHVDIVNMIVMLHQFKEDLTKL